MIRKAFVSGYFYPAEKLVLQRVVKDLLSRKKRVVRKAIKALVVPHAAYEYSGSVAASAYKQIEGLSYNKVFVMASNHSYKLLEGVSIGNFDYYETPLGKVRVSEVAKKMVRSKLFKFVPEVHTTHVIEVQLPFLQQTIRKFELVPMIFGRVDMSYLQAVAKEIEKKLEENDLIVVSTDLSHYYDYETAKRLDEETIEKIMELNTNGLVHHEACSLEALITLCLLAKKKNWKVKFLEYANSGDVSDNKYEVVGYASLVFYE